MHNDFDHIKMLIKRAIQKSLFSSSSKSILELRESAKKRIADVDRASPYGLMDSFQRQHTYLRISLTERCNLRCTYCMPEEGISLTPQGRLLNADEIFRIASLFVKSGVKKIRLTGGEPTIRKDIVEIVARLSSLKCEGLDSIGITTNGIALDRKLQALSDAGLNSINFSLDTLDEHKFTLITRRPGFKSVMKSIKLAQKLPFDKLKINCVVMRGVNHLECVDFVDFVRNTSLIIRFIEYMPFDGTYLSLCQSFIPFPLIFTAKEINGRTTVWSPSKICCRSSKTGTE
eukprot:Partr_v1_DN27859_c2_g1_i2_m22788 putative molybdenum cofactor